jgi:hypothetical protein
MKKWEVRVLPFSFDVMAENELKAEAIALQWLKDNDGQVSEHIAIEEDEE